GGTDVQGIKTATTIWIAAAIGLTAATGLWWLTLLIGGLIAVMLYLTDWLSAGRRQAEPREAETNR
ncbi:MAG: MgtC/SapB family protein, partial [Chloroflexota bacterium]|nr:MgtC/SapB family protein [Chloroflexota bacterium]